MKDENKKTSSGLLVILIYSGSDPKTAASFPTETAAGLLQKDAPAPVSGLLRIHEGETHQLYLRLLASRIIDKAVAVIFRKTSEGD